MLTEAMAMSEAELQSRVRKRCDELGLLVQHNDNSKRTWVKGWPDLEIIGPGGIAYRELKRQNESLEPDQRVVAAAIIEAGGNFMVWKPSDLLNGRIERQLIALSRRRING